jgi:phosphoribosyl-AMP cyclohydrolase
MATYYYVSVPDQTTVHLRSTAESNTSNVIGEVPHGTKVTFLSTLSPYMRVNAPVLGVGYIHTNFLVSTPPAGGGSSTSAWQSRYGTTVWKKSTHSGTFYTEVQNIQKDLRKVGYTSISNADGYYGSITETAVKNFQKNWSLTQDGICGNATKQKLWDHPDR